MSKTTRAAHELAPWMFLVMTGCAAQPTKASSTKAAPPKSAPSRVVEREVPMPASPESVAPPAVQAPQEPKVAEHEPSGVERVASVCEQHCSKVETACKAQTAEVCRANCESYVIQAETCPVEVLRAMACRTDAEEVVLCSVMVPDSCTTSFGRMKDCVAGKTPSEAETDNSSIPAGFAKLDVVELGVSLYLPPNTTKTETPNGPRHGAALSGIEYFVESVPGAPAKPNDKTILRSALAYLGHDCESKLKLHGRFDKDGAIFVRYDAVCKDTTSWHGMFIAQPDKMTSVAARRGPANTAEFVELEPFLFGVTLLPEQK